MTNHAKFVPPRVLTGEGEAFNSEDRGIEVPRCLIGMPASTGIVEGPAGIVHRPEEVALQTGDILVAPFTDQVGCHFFNRLRLGGGSWEDDDARLEILREDHPEKR